MGEHVANHHHLDEDVRVALWGPWKPNAIGHVRDESKGIAYQVAALWKESPSRKLKTSDRAALWLTATAVIADRVLSQIL